MSDPKNLVLEAIDAILSANTKDETAKAVLDAKQTAENEIDSLEETISELEREAEELEEVAEGTSGEVAEAVHTFLDEVDRPVGTLTFIVPDVPAVNRAIRGLYDATNRNL